jgi:DNA transposition AAA+ family ATPase
MSANTALKLVNIERDKKLPEPRGYADALKRFINKYKFSQAQMSAKIGISTASLSQVLQDQYKYDPANRVWQQIFRFFSQFEKQVYETTVLKKIFLLLNMAFDENKIAVIISEFGTGKTTAQKQYCLINPDAVFIRVTAVFTMKYMLQKMLESLGSPFLGMSNQAMMEALYDIAERKNKIFLFDEAERLTIRQLDLLRDLYDMGNIGLALVGEPALKDKLMKGRSGYENLGRLYSRIAFYTAVDVLEESDVRTILDDQFPGNKISDQMITTITGKFKNHGSYRGVIDQLCDHVKKGMLKNRKECLTDDIIQNVFKKIIQIQGNKWSRDE